MSYGSNNFKTGFRRRLYRLLWVGVAAYAVACIGCASFQRRMIYYPPRLTAGQVDLAARSAGLERWLDSSGQAIGRPGADCVWQRELDGGLRSLRG